jgi:hypothetical protein
MSSVNSGTTKTVEDMSVSDYAVAGVITGFGCALVESPIDFFKSQLQTQVCGNICCVRRMECLSCL